MPREQDTPERNLPSKLMTTPEIPATPSVARLTYTVDEAAAAIGVSKPTIYRLIVRGHLCPVPNLRHKLIPCEQLHRYVAGERHHGRN
jgi:excisionase family DNA binding protein